MRNRGKQRELRRETHQRRAKERPISYYNGERYADPTAYAAVKNLVKKESRN